MKKIPLGSAKQTSAQKTATEASFASTCGDYQAGEPIVAKVKPGAGFVGGTAVSIGMRNNGQDAPKSCTQCDYFAPAKTVSGSLGWSQPLCLARGNLLNSKIYRSEANSCDVGVKPGQGGATVAITDFTPLPAYSIEVTGEEVARVKTIGGDDPLAYETDKPVTTEDQAHGIIAWREVKHPNGLKNATPVYIPVFDPESFTEEERALIPRPGDDDMPELYRDYAGLIYRMALNMFGGFQRAVTFIGHAGVGKTEGLKHLAYLTQAPFVRLSITAATEPATVVGRHLVSVDRESSQSVTEWVDGRLSKWWDKRCVICLDEPNTAQPELWQTLRSLTDGSKTLVLDEDRGQMITRGPFTMFGMCINPDWDHRYIGVEKINAADAQRVGGIWVDYPPIDVEAEIIAAKCLASGYQVKQTLVDALVKIGEDIRKSSDPTTGGDLDVTWSIRVAVSIALYTQFLSLQEAVAMALSDWVEPEQRDIIRGIVRTYERTSKGSK